MKKILLLLLFTLLSQGVVFANDSSVPGNAGAPPPETSKGGGVEGEVPGYGPTKGPIDTNKAVLIITAALIAGVMGYRKTSLRKV